jgi:hypothetical protein
MIEALARIPFTDFLTDKMTEVAAKVAREARGCALAAGQTVTTYKDGRLVRGKMQGGRVIELFNEVREHASLSDEALTPEDV